MQHYLSTHNPSNSQAIFSEQKVKYMKQEIIGWFYLHVNGSLIYKNYPAAILDIRDSDLATSAWHWENSRKHAWGILVEAGSLGVSKARINELANAWDCNDADAPNYAEFIGIILGVDGNMKTATKSDFKDLQISPAGFGDTYLEAMQALCKEIGFTGGKIGWHSTFESLCNPEFVDKSF